MGALHLRRIAPDGVWEETEETEYPPQGTTTTHMSTKQHEETIGTISASWPIAIDVFAEWIGQMQTKGATDVRFWVNGDKREGEYYFVDAFRTCTEKELLQKEIASLEQKLAELKSQQPHT